MKSYSRKIKLLGLVASVITIAAPISHAFDSESEARMSGERTGMNAYFVELCEDHETPMLDKLTAWTDRNAQESYYSRAYTQSKQRGYNAIRNQVQPMIDRSELGASDIEEICGESEQSNAANAEQLKELGILPYDF